MRRPLAALALCTATLLAQGWRPAAAADGGSADPLFDQIEAARRAAPLTQIGSRTIPVGELEDRLAALPAFQRRAFGPDDDAIKKKFLLEVLIPEGLFALGAADRKLDRALPTAFDVERARHNATLRAIREQIGPAAAIPMSDVQAYYDANRDRFDTPERYELWRILCKTQEEAQAVLDQARKDATPKTFGELAREHSLDKATNLRMGNLGFVTAAGTSSEPGLRVDPAVIRAAQGVKDGQLVAAPVAEGDGYSVLWRRGHIAASKRAVEDVAAQIRDTLWKTRVKDAVDRRLAALRTERVKDYSDGPLFDLDVSSLVDAGALAVRRDQ